MKEIKPIPPKEKSNFHPRNKHNARYDFDKLIQAYPELKQYLVETPHKDTSIDFFNPQAVKALNKALLFHFYKLTYWEIPENYLCPPIPSRADYLHYAADLIFESTQKAPSKADIEKALTFLDLGTGANCIYPLIGAIEYPWKFIGTEIDAAAMASAQKIIDKNILVRGKIELRLQKEKKQVLKGLRLHQEKIALVMCNPPFHGSAEEAQSGSVRKIRNLKKKRVDKPVLNFGGQSNELWCEGGEVAFVSTMIQESRYFSKNCLWFTCLVSNKEHLKKAYSLLRKTRIEEVRTIEMQHGNKHTRILAWTYVAEKDRLAWLQNPKVIALNPSNKDAENEFEGE